jgi:predicted AAA+ superfamily ATPase
VSIASAQALHAYLAGVLPSEGRGYVLLDEIQEVPEWERLVNSLLAEGRTDVYITGSNSRLLSGELATYIAGRYVSIEVWPLSFGEYLAFGAAYSKRDTGPNRTIRHETVLNYLAALAEAFVISRVPRYDIRGRALLATAEKHYVGDHGIVHALFGYSDRRLPGVLENIVWLELRRRGYEVTVGKVGTTEVDFVARRQEDTIYVQVATTIAASAETRRREYAPLEAIADNYPKYVLSLDRLRVTGAVAFTTCGFPTSCSLTPTDHRHQQPGWRLSRHCYAVGKGKHVVLSRQLPSRTGPLLSRRYPAVPSVDALRASMNATRNWRRSSGSGFSVSRADSVIPAERSSDTT